MSKPLEDFINVFSFLNKTKVPHNIIHEEDQVRFELDLTDETVKGIYHYIVVNSEGIHMNNFSYLSMKTVINYINTYR